MLNFGSVFSNFSMFFGCILLLTTTNSLFVQHERFYFSFHKDSIFFGVEFLKDD